MKKYFTYLIISFIVLFLTGCTNDITFNKNDIIEIHYNKVTILKEDYSKITNFFHNIHFSKRKSNEKFKEKLTISTKNQFHQFSFSDHHILKYQSENKTYYSYNKKTNQKLQEQLKTITKKYHNKNFFSINYFTDYKENEKDTVIKIDHVNQYFKLKFTEPITELKIHKVEEHQNTYQDIDLVYQEHNINDKTPVIIRINPLKDYYRYRISFTNKYGLSVSIIPTYETEKETGKLKYIIEYQYP